MTSIRSHCALLLMAVVLLFASCESSNEKLDITIKTDYSGLVAQIENVNLSLLERMSLLQKAMESGLADNQAAIELIQQAVESMSGSLNDKLAALEEAVKSQTISLETKLSIIEAAISTGFADEKAAQELLKEAVESLGGTMETKLAAIDSTLASQQATLSAKLALIETAVEDGFAGEKTRQELIQQALEALSGSLEEKLKAIEETMESQFSGLDTKLELIQEALTKGFADEKTALSLISTAVSSLKGVVNGMDKDIDAVVATLGTLDPTTGTVSAALKNLLQDVSGMTDYPTMLACINQTVGELWVVVKYTGHSFVDLGNGLKWATMNVGASRPEEFGDYFAWGEIIPYYYYNNTLVWITGKTGGYDWASYFDNPSHDGISFNKYGLNTDKLKRLGLEDDAARSNWGGNWRMPTQEELDWLLELTTQAWTNDYNGTGVRGVILKSNVEGYEDECIFVPAAGYRKNTDGPSNMSDCFLWSSFIYSPGIGSGDSAYGLNLNETSATNGQLNGYLRSYGFTIRPVAD